MNYSNRPHYQWSRDAQRMGGVRLWLVFRCLPAIVIGTLLLLLLWVAPARALVDGDSQALDLNGLESGHMLLRETQSGRYIPALVQSGKVHFDISGLIATVTVEQTFGNQTDQWLEGVYGFPLPEGAAVRFMELQVGGRRIIGKVREREQAARLYRKARESGKKASLVEQQRPNLFTSRVANIGPGEEVTVHLEYVQQVAFSGDTLSLRFPMTITPRYIPGRSVADEERAPGEQTLAVDSLIGWARPTDQVPDADVISPVQHPGAGSTRAPLNPVQVTASLDMGMPLASVSSPYHEIALARRAGVYAIRLANGVSEMDRDFVLNWQPVTGAAPAAAVFTERVGEQYYGLLMVVPPAVPPASAQRGSTIPRDIVIVVDTSGSMGGVSIEQARASVSDALRQLGPDDRFNIIEFNSSYRSLYRRPMPATRHHVERAQEFVRQLSATGGTEMLPALQAALTPAVQADEFRDRPALRQVIFITDGAVGNEEALFEEIAVRVGDSRLFTVGIGSAPNSWFMRKAAQFGRGSHTHIGDLNELGAKIGGLFEQLSSPAAVDMAVTWPGTVAAFPQRIPDLYSGQPLSLVVNFGTSAPQGVVTVSGRINDRVWSRQLQLADGADPHSVGRHKGVASLWARRKIAGLLDQKVRGREEALVRADVLAVALPHQLLSPYTSFVAVEEQISRPAGKATQTKPVANSRPRGQSPQTFAYPRTATTGPARVWLGVLLLFIAIIVRVMRQPEADHERAQRD